MAKNVYLKNIDGPEAIFKMIYIFKRLSDEWGERFITPSLPGFKMAYMPVFTAIPPEGISNKELASLLKVSKMSTSKVVKELQNLQLVTSVKNTTDARSEILLLTARGKRFFRTVTENAEQLVAEYKKVAGAKNYEQSMNVLYTITQYHETHNSQ